MITHFICIEDFRNTKTNCMFCNGKLDFVFTNWLEPQKYHLHYNVIIKTKEISFELKYNSSNLNIDAIFSVNTESNIIECFDKNDTDVEKLITTLGTFFPHLELQCNNKECCTYTISSNKFAFSDTRCTPVKILPFNLLNESFFSKLGNRSYYVQNSVLLNTTCITDTKEPTSSPLTLPLVSFDGLDRAAVFKKISTLINFS